VNAKKTIGMWIGILGLAMLLGACSSSTENRTEGTLTLGFGGELDHMYPTMTSFHNLQATELVYDTLVTFDNGEVKPRLATSWTFNSEGTELTLKLREGVSFHDGEPFNAAAVKANLDYYRQEPNAAFIKGVSMIEALEVVDNYTIKLLYRKPYYAILHDLTTPHILAMVSPKTILPGNYERMSGTVGTGPYRYSEFVKGDRTVFTSFEEYWGDRPAYETIVAKYIPDSASRLKALQTGEIDLIFGSSLLTFDDYKQVIGLKGINGQVSEGTLKTRAITVNASGAMLGELSVREAVAHAIDAKTIADGLTYGYETAADHLFDEDVPYGRAGTVPAHGYDPEEAGKRLDEAGWALNSQSGYREKDGKRLSLVFSYDNGEAINKLIVTAIQSQLQKVGIEVETRGLDMMTWWMESLEGKFDLTVWNTGGPTQDPHNFINPMLDSTAQTAALSGLDGAQAFMDAVQTSFTTSQDEDIEGMYAYFIDYLTEEGIVIPLTYAKELVVYRTDAMEEYSFGGVLSLFNPAGVKR